MRTGSWLHLLASIVAATFAVVTKASDSLTLSASERTAITNELIKWKSSPVGLEARRKGLIPSSLGIEDVTDDEISRFIRAKQAVAQLQVDQPSAVFTINTPYALLSHDEYLARLYGEVPPVPSTPSNVSVSEVIRPVIVNNTETRDLSAQVDEVVVDWSGFGCVTPAEDEGTCNAPGAFATVSTIETNYCINSPTHKLYRLSKQDLMTCSLYPSCRYVDSPTSFYDWITSINKGTVCTAATLPYTMKDYISQSCTRYNDPSVTCESPDLQVASYMQRQFPDHRELEALLKTRSVTATMAGCYESQYYSAGVLRGDVTKCPAPYDISAYRAYYRVVQIVGYGSLDGIPYWKIKNSLGPYWGYNGFAFIERGYQGEVYGTSGIEQWITYPLFKSELDSNFDSIRVRGPRGNVELLGPDLKVTTTMMYSPSACNDFCRREPGCKGYAWYGNDYTCHLKSAITGERRPTDPNVIVSSGVAITKDEMLNGACLTPEDNVDYPDNDFYNTLAASPAECCDMCFRTRLCEAYTWSQYKGGSCYFKYRRAEKPVTKAPAPDGSAYFRSGVVYKCQPLQFNTDFVGNDYKSVGAAGPMDCCGICRYEGSYCAGYSWTNYNGGTCWLKSRVPDNGIGTYAAGVFAAAV